MVVEQPTIPVLLAREIVQPLYLFIIMSIIVWFFDNYKFYGTVIFFTLVIGVTINLYETYETNKKIHEMAYYEAEVNVLREDKIVKFSSKDIVPGDIVFFKKAMKIPFDCILL